MSEPVDPGMETPLAELPPVDEPQAQPTRVPRKRPAPPGPWRAGLAHARGSWRVLLVVVLVQLLLGVTVVLPFYQGLAERLDHHPHAAELAGVQPDPIAAAQGWQAGLDAGIWRDLQHELKPLFDSLTLTHFWVVVVAWLFGALVAGGLIGTAVSGEDPVRVGSFLACGAKGYGRMLRVGIVFGLAYYLVARLVLEAWGKSVEPTEFMAPSEGAAWWGDRLREGILVLCFLWFRVAADLGRAELLVYAKRSALGAFWRGLWRAFRRRAWLTALIIGLPAFALLLVLGFVAQGLTGDATLTLVLLFVVIQLAVGIRWASRAALLGAYAKAS